MNATKKHQEIKENLLPKVEKLLHIATQNYIPTKPAEQPMSLKQYLKDKQAKTPLQIRYATGDYINFFGNRETGVVEEQGIVFETENGKFTIPDATLLPFMQYAVKTGFGNGKQKRVATSIGPQHWNYQSKNMQGGVVEARAIWQTNETELKNYPQRLDKVKQAKQKLKKQYKNAHPSDPIRRCWKYITNPNTIEGVNIPWKEKPTARFTPYSEICKPTSSNYPAINRETSATKRVPTHTIATFSIAI